MAAGRARKRIGFAVITLSVAALAIVVVSRWVELLRISPVPGWRAAISGGEVQVAYWHSMGTPRVARPPGWHLDWRKPPRGPGLISTEKGSILGVVEIRRPNGFGLRGTIVTVYPALPAAAGLVAGAAALWSARRAVQRSGACSSCGYALDGLPAGSACPECGGLGDQRPAH
ncbi:MAG: hypothetical protein HEQ23_02490 [Tepidisphaera sp.]